MRCIVFGAAGHLGRAVCRKLAKEGHSVLALRKSLNQTFSESTSERIETSYYNVVTKELGEEVAACLTQGPSFDAIIYCVGHCPRGGFKDAVKWPLSIYESGDLQNEIDMHITGPFNVYQEFMQVLKPGGHFVFMSTAATRILDMKQADRPDIHIYPHLGAIRGGDALIEGMRKEIDLEKSRRAWIHKICPPRITDSPFHSSDAELHESFLAPIGVTTAEVVDKIMVCLRADGHVDVMMGGLAPTSSTS